MVSTLQLRYSYKLEHFVCVTRNRFLFPVPCHSRLFEFDLWYSGTAKVNLKFSYETHTHAHTLTISNLLIVNLKTYFSNIVTMNKSHKLSIEKT